VPVPGSCLFGLPQPSSLCWPCSRRSGPARGWYLWGPSGTRLISPNEGNFGQFTRQFDSAANDERVVLLASPT